jgi:hypothetical protein
MTAFLAYFGSLVALPLALFMDGEDPILFVFIVLLAGPLFFGVTYMRYRNRGERHYHERETTVRLDNLQTYDNFVQHIKGTSSPTIKGANGTQVEGSLVKDPMKGILG